MSEEETFSQIFTSHFSARLKDCLSEGNEKFQGNIFQWFKFSFFFKLKLISYFFQFLKIIFKLT